LGGILYAAGLTPTKVAQKSPATMNTLSHPNSISAYDTSGKLVRNAAIASGKQPPGVYVMKSSFGIYSSVSRAVVGR
jgi:hypothetical protein